MNRQSQQIDSSTKPTVQKKRQLKRGDEVEDKDKSPLSEMSLEDIVDQATNKVIREAKIYYNRPKPKVLQIQPA